MDYCCNPFGKTDHKTNRRFKKDRLRNVTPALVQSARSINIRLAPHGKKVCVDCRINIQKKAKEKNNRPNIALPGDQHQIAQPQAQQQLAQEQADDGNMDIDMELPDSVGPKYPSPAVNYVDTAEFIRKLNEILPQIDVTAIDFEKISRSRSYCRNKLDEISTNLAAKIFNITTPGVREVVEENCEQEIVNQLKEKFAETTKKEQKNFYQLCQYKASHAFDVEWHFFATSHGKGPCDGIGSFKRNATRASLQRPYNNQITTAKELYDWAVSKDSNIVFRFCSEAAFNKVERHLNSKFKKVHVVSGTHKFHSFIPLDDKNIKALRFSTSNKYETFQLID